MNNKVFQYYLSKGNTKAAMRIKAAYFRQQEPHQRDIRRKRRIKIYITRMAGVGQPVVENS